MSCEYSSDDCWEGDVVRQRPARHIGAPCRRSFDDKGPLPHTVRDKHGRRSGAGAAEEPPITDTFFDSEPAGNEKYEVSRLLGKGQYGTVVAARHRRTQKKCAIKHISHVFVTKADAVRTIRELRFLRVFKHPNVVRLHDVMVPRVANSFDDVYLVTELLETDLASLIKSKTVLDDVHNRWIMYQLLRALAYVHGANVSHRDIKPANIVLDSHCNLKLCDFGLARADFPRDTETPIFWTDYVATRWYRAPELLCSHCEQYTTQIDLWAAGCIMGELVKRRPMFPGSNAYRQIDLITNFTGTPSQSSIDKMRNAKAREHLMRQVPPKPHEDSHKKFPSLGDEGLSMLHGLLTFDPSDREDAATSLQHSFFKSIRESIDESFIQPPPTMKEVDFVWEDEASLTTTQLRRKLYDEILAFHPEALARGIAAAAAKVAETTATGGGPGGAAIGGALAAANRPNRSKMSVDALTGDRRTLSGEVHAAMSQNGASASELDEDGPLPDYGGLEDDMMLTETESPRREESLPPETHKEQWGHIVMGGTNGATTSESGYGTSEGDHDDDAHGMHQPISRTPSMCSLTSGSDKSEPISTVSDHAWSSHEFHHHHLFHEEPAMPKFAEETEEMIISLGADSPQLGPTRGSSDSEQYSPVQKAVEFAGAEGDSPSKRKPGWSFSLAADGDDDVFNRDAAPEPELELEPELKPEPEPEPEPELVARVHTFASRSMLQPPDDADADAETEQLQPVSLAVTAAAAAEVVHRPPLTRRPSAAEMQEAWTLLPPVSPGPPTARPTALEAGDGQWAEALLHDREAQQLEIVNALLAGGRSGSAAALLAGMTVAPVVPPVMGPGADMSRGDTCTPVIVAAKRKADEAAAKAKRKEESKAARARQREAKAGAGGGGGGVVTCCGAPVRAKKK